jgi:hypothetical protein
MTVRLLAVCAGRPESAGRILVLVSVRGSVDGRKDYINWKIQWPHGNRTRYLLTWCKALQPTTLQHAAIMWIVTSSFTDMSKSIFVDQQIDIQRTTLEVNLWQKNTSICDSANQCSLPYVSPSLRNKINSSSRFTGVFGGTRTLPGSDDTRPHTTHFIRPILNR